jgi:hypothetical protein
MNGDATASLTTSLEQRDAEVSGLTTQMERLGHNHDFAHRTLQLVVEQT